MSNSNYNLYFAYGSNLWLDQMKRRCPGSKFVGIATLSGWKWIINTRGYANVIPSNGDIVYGMLYELTADDETKLDGYEGVPHAYIKQILPVVFIQDRKCNSTVEGRNEVDALVYVDVERLEKGSPHKEYITRINQGIVDATQNGIPMDYFDKYIRVSIPTSNPI